MLRVIENPKQQSRPEFFDNSAKLDLNKNEGKSSKIDFEPLIIARPTELIEKLLPRFDSSCRKLIEKNKETKELLDSECDSIIHANSSNNGITNDPPIAVSPDCDTTSHANSSSDGAIINSNSSLSADNGMTDRNTESKFEISKYDIQKERNEFLMKLLCENRERRKSIVNENAKTQDIENKCTLAEKKVDGGGETLQPQASLTVCGGGGTFAKDTFNTCRGGGASP
jgi:hypothetical protein